MSKQTRRRHYSKEFKESVLQRLEPPTKDTVTSLSKELDISRATIYQWVRNKENQPKELKPAMKWSSKDKFHAVLETATLSVHYFRYTTTILAHRVDYPM